MPLQMSSKVLKACCVLDHHLTLEQLSNHEFYVYTRQEKSSCRNALRQECGGKPPPGRLLISDLAGKTGCQTTGPVDSELSKMHGAAVHLLRFCSMHRKTGE